MQSLIFSSTVRILYWMMFAASLFILFRGHDEPGGGFVGGLVAAMAVGIVALADGVPAARKRLRLHPVSLVGLGLVCAFASGLPGLFTDGSFLSHQWAFLDNGLKLGTTMIFDLGVYFVVLGGMLSLIFRLYEDAP